MNRSRSSAFDQAKGEYHKKYKLLAPYVPELIAIKAGLRTAIQMTLPREKAFGRKLAMLKEFCKKVGFFLEHYEFNRENKILLSRKNLNAVDWENKTLEYQMGELCAYPDCCIENFASHKEWTHPLINNVRDLIDNNQSYTFKMNPFLRTSPFHLTKHFPCGLDCTDSIRLAGKLLEVIKTENAVLHRDIVRFNRAPALFTDICGIGILFDGQLEGHRLVYSEVYYDHDPSSIFQLSSINKPEEKALFIQIIEATSKGDELILDAGRLLIQASGRRLSAIDCPSHLGFRLVDFQ